jgi:hypothetical protein
MTQFWTAIIWGAGFSLGANVGVFVFVFIFTASRKVSDGVKTQRDVNERSIAALERRNEIGCEMVQSLTRLAEAAERTNEE